jgi:uncharacterized membrane protein
MPAMRETLASLFLPLCGQYAPHVWSPGGIALPCCQRCSGLYAGALIALLLQVFLRPRWGNAGQAIHGLMLLQVVPLGLHWVPQGPVLRSWSGLWLGFAAVCFLWAAPARWWALRRGSASRVPAGKVSPSVSCRFPPGSRAFYFAILAATMALVPLAGACGGPAAGTFLAAAAVGGVLALGLLALANLLLAAAWLVQRVFRPPAATSR